MTAAACSGSRIRLQPPLCLAIFGTGQPMITSPMSAPMPSTICAASAIFSGSPPKIWIENRPLLFGVLTVFERAIDAAAEPFRAHHLRDDKTATAMSFHHPAESCVAHPRHRATTNGEERSLPAPRLIPRERGLRRVVNDEHLPARPTAFARIPDGRHHH